MADLTYWQKRHLKTKQKALNNAEKYEADYLKRLNKAHREIEKEIKAWAKKYATEDGGMTQANANKLLRGMDKKDWNNTLAQWEHKARVGGYDNELNLEYYRSRVSRLQALQGQITDIMATHTAPEVGRMQQQLADTYKDTYYRTTYNTQAQQMAINGNFARFNDDQLTKIVSKPWAGSDFSKRLWGNMTTKLPNELTKTLSRGVLLGHGVERMVKDARVTLNNASRYDLHRLITTEFAHITEQATLDSYHDSGIERYEYMATLETHTCERCGALDSEVIDTNKQQAGVNYPPLHPNCRCTTAPWFEELEEMDTDRWARNPDNGKGETVSPMSYDEWKKEVGVNDTPVKATKVPSLFGKGISDKLNDSQLKTYSDLLSKAPEPIQKMFNKFKDTFKFEDVNHEDAAHFDPKTKSVSYNVENDLAGNKAKASGGTFFHEFAHSIDDSMGNISKGFNNGGYKSSLREQMDSEWGRYFADKNKEMKKQYKELGLRDFAEQNNVSWIGLTSKKSLNKKDAEWVVLNKLSAEHSLMARADISDWLEYPTKRKYPLGAGHGVAYHHNYGDMTSGEIFAEITSAYVANPESLALMKQMFPETMAAYDRLLKEIN